jgi:DNA polymerase delta subunit 1
LYIAAPTGFKQEYIPQYAMWLNSKLGYGQIIHSAELVIKENLYGYQGKTKKPYIKITVIDHKDIGKLRNSLEKNFSSFNYKGLWQSVDDGGIMTFDNIQYVLRFMIDTGVSLDTSVWAPIV